MNDIFNTEWYKRFNHGSMNEFLALSQRFKRFGLTYEDVYDAIKSACDFFRIPMPRMIQDLTNVHNGQTMFVCGCIQNQLMVFNKKYIILFTIFHRQLS